MNGMPWCTEPFNFDGIHHDRIAVPDTLRVQDTISFLVISELGVTGMLRLQTGQRPVGFVHHSHPFIIHEEMIFNLCPRSIGLIPIQFSGICYYLRRKIKFLHLGTSHLFCA